MPPYNPVTYDAIMADSRYKIIELVEKYIKDIALKNNIKVVGSYNPYVYYLKSSNFFDGIHALDDVYSNVFKNLLD